MALVAHTALFSICATPGNASLTQQLVMRYYSFKYEFFAIGGAFTHKPAHSAIYSHLGYTTTNFIPQQYTFLVFLAMALGLALILAVVIRATIANFRRPGCRRLGTRLPDAAFFGRILLRLFLQSCLEVFITCYVGFRSIQSVDAELERSTADGLSVILAIVMLCLYFPVIARMVWVPLVHFNELADPETVEKYGHYYVDLDIMRRGQVLYHAVFVLRRMLFCLVLFELEG